MAGNPHPISLLFQLRQVGWTALVTQAVVSVPRWKEDWIVAKQKHGTGYYSPAEPKNTLGILAQISGHLCNRSRPQQHLLPQLWRPVLWRTTVLRLDISHITNGKWSQSGTSYCKKKRENSMKLPVNLWVTVTNNTLQRMAAFNSFPLTTFSQIF